MRAILLSLILRLAVQQAPPDLAVLEGRLLHQGTSEPISGAQISVARLNPNLPQTSEALNAAQNVALVMKNPNASSPGYVEGFLTPTAQLVGVSPDLLRPLSQVGVVTDEAGRFRFSDLAPGLYALSAERTGYFGPRYGDNSGATLFRLLTIEPGKRPSALNLVMMRGGVISGRVRDPKGQPVSGMRVSAYQAIYPGGRAGWNSEGLNTTNDRGEFRLGFLAPGQYFVGTATAYSQPGATGLTPVHTYYPGVPDPALASALVVTDGLEITGIDLDLRTSSAPTYKISGTAINTAATPRPNDATGVVDRSVSSFFLVPRQPSLTDSLLPTFQNMIARGSRPNGEFEIQNVKPGTYELFPQVMDFISRRSFTSRTFVTVKDEDVAGISITVGAGATLEVEVVVEGGALQAIKPDSLRLRLRPADSTPDMLVSALGTLPFSSTGKLRVENVPEARYTAVLSGLPEGAYVSDIHQSGKSAYNEGVAVGPQPPELVRVTIGLGGATVEGIVRALDGKPASNATVILVPPVTRRANPMAFKTATTDDAGRFSMKGVMPSGYTLFALQSRPYREPWLNAAFLAKYLGRGRLINAVAGSTVDTPLGLITD